ncbi:acetate--CoA ligase family protein [Sodalis-like endosymbiont of Proechinophthirus fluctus]|uniref:acetate--CoA ligase family protein n=1 Tax=Sodalis-like endosymbiont of Proechinophthirus fluctus TaxID=1462730 RepID=UPI00093D0FC0
MRPSEGRGYPVAMKLHFAGIAHKSDVQWVIFALRNVVEVTQVASAMLLPPLNMALDYHLICYRD